MNSDMPQEVNASVFLQDVLKVLLPHYEEYEARSIAFELLERQFNMSKHDVVLGNEVVLPANHQLEEYLQRLIHQEPIQYITEVADFYGLEFQVNPHVLIPRPETEELVHLIIQEQNERQNVNILDIGTGSGCIPISLKKNLPKAAVYGVDISLQALQVAHENAVKNEVTVNFSQLDVLTQDLSNFPKFQVIVSNPPYVRALEKEKMQANVLDHEPHLALFVPNANPLLFYKRITQLAAVALENGGMLYFEINEAFGKECLELLANYGFQQISLIKDMQGKDRMVKGMKNTDF
ncbi:MAG: peptide chain release factor N(5)-glutamine methyltransferase [Flammeovirgaceae bacterium]